MAKETYSISIAQGIIQKGSFTENVDFEVLATPEEAERLREGMERLNADDRKGFIRAHIPYKSAENDQSEKEYDEDLRIVYGMIYELGTPKTKRFIEEMNINQTS